MNKEERKEYMKEYYIRNKEYRIKNRDEILRKNKKNYQKSKDKYKKYYEKNKDKLKENDLKRKHNLSLIEFNQMMFSQNYSCDICRNGITGNRHTHVDHNHITKENRGLLCNHCNLGIGHAKENIIIIQNAITYINSNYDNENYKELNQRTRKLKRQELKLLQNNKCFICGDSFKNNRDCHLDHNHNTNKIRKVICRGCNSMLGHFKDNVVIMQSAIDYLNKHNSKIQEVVYA